MIISFIKFKENNSLFDIALNESIDIIYYIFTNITILKIKDSNYFNYK